MATPLKGQQLADWYNRINTVRNRTGIALGNISVPNVSKQTATAEQINNLKNSINALKSNTYLGKADYTAINNVSVQSNDLIQLSTKINIESTITSLEGICANTYTTGDSVRQFYDAYDSLENTGDTDRCSANYANDTDFTQDRKNVSHPYTYEDGYYTNCSDEEWNCHGYCAANKATHGDTIEYNANRAGYTNNTDLQTNYTVTGNSYTG